MSAASSARTVVFLLSGELRATLPLPLPANQPQPASEDQDAARQQPPVHHKRKRRRTGVRSRRANGRDRPPPPSPRLQAANTPLTEEPHSDNQRQTEPQSPDSAPHSLPVASSRSPLTPLPLPPAASSAATVPLSPVFSVCDDSSSPPSPVYDYDCDALHSSQQQQQRSDVDEPTESSAAAVCESHFSHQPADECGSADSEVDEVMLLEVQPSRQQRSHELHADDVPAAAGGGADVDLDVQLLGEAAASDTDDSVVADDVVTLLINGHHEHIRRASQSQSLVAFQPTAPSTTSASASLAATSAQSRRRVRHHQLTFNSDLSLTATRSAALPSVNNSVCVDAAVVGRVPSLFQPRSREIQQRMTRLAATAGSARKKSTAPANHRSTSTDGGRSTGKKRAVHPSPSSPRSTTTPQAANTARVDVQSPDSNQSRFGDCPLCGESLPITTLMLHVNAECNSKRLSHPRQPPRVNVSQPVIDVESVGAGPVGGTADAATEAAPSLSESRPPSSSSSSQPPRITSYIPSSSPLLPSDTAVSVSALDGLVTALPPPTSVVGGEITQPGQFELSAAATAVGLTAIASPRRSTVSRPPFHSPLKPPPSRSTFLVERQVDSAEKAAEEAQRERERTEAAERFNEQSEQQPQLYETDTSSADNQVHTAQPINHTSLSVTPASEHTAAALSATTITSASLPPPCSHGTLSSSSSFSGDGNLSPTAAAPHPFFTSGALNSASFASKRESRLDGSRPDRIAWLHLQLVDGPAVNHTTTHSANTANTASLLSLSPSSAVRNTQWRVQWLEESPTSAASGSPLIPLHTLTVRDAVDGSSVLLHATCEEWVYKHPRVDLTSTELLCNKPSGRRFDFSPSQLKSLLQKNIRMSRPMAAVRSALQLAVRAGLNELLRRLSVIMVEDAILHPLMPLLVWLTLVCGEKRRDGGTSISGNGANERRDGRQRVLGKDGTAENRSMCHPPTLQLLNAVLHIVFDIAAVAVKDSTPTVPKSGNEQSAHIPTPHLSLSSADVDCADVSAGQLVYVRCLLLRSHLGGMEGDMAMLRRFAALWARRFAAENKQCAAAQREVNQPAPRRWLPFLSQLFDNSRLKHGTHTHSGNSSQQLSALSVASVQDDDILLSAIDQHCSPLIDQLRADNSRVKDSIARHVVNIQQKRQQAKTMQQPASLPTAADAGVEADDGRVDVVRLLNTAIWRHRSSVTNKRPLLQSSKQSGAVAAAGEQQDSDASYQLFQLIKAEADQISRRIVAQRLAR